MMIKRENYIIYINYILGAWGFLSFLVTVLIQFRSLFCL